MSSSSPTNNKTSSNNHSSGNSSSTDAAGVSPSFQQQQQSLFSSPSTTSSSSTANNNGGTTKNTRSYPSRKKRPFKFVMIMPWMIVISCVGVSFMNQRRLKTFYSFQSSYNDVSDTPQLRGSEDESQEGSNDDAAAAAAAGELVVVVEDEDEEDVPGEERGLARKNYNDKELSSPESSPNEVPSTLASSTEAEAPDNVDILEGAKSKSEEEDGEDKSIQTITEQSNKLRTTTEISSTNNNRQVTSGNSSPYAYMFVIGGIHEHKPAYKGFIYNVLVATSQLRKLGSTYDVVLYVQLSADSNRTQLPDEDTQHLEALNIQIRTLPKPLHGETFASLVFEKFRPLEMTEYRRVIFLDADAIPVANMDYIFHLSDPSHTTTPTILRPNLILASRAEACNAGMFMLQPEEGAWDELNGIIHRVHEEGLKLPYPHFDWQRGWGYNFVAEKDYWRGTQKTGNRWKYHAGHSDQGLLYYWTKFYKRDVSIVILDEIENWVDGGSSAPLTVDGKPKPVLEATLRGEPLLNYTAVHPTAYQFNCDMDTPKGRDKKNQLLQCVVPYRDFAHFMGKSKPWQEVPCPTCFAKSVGKSTSKYNAATKLWFEELQELDTKLNMNLDFDNWGDKHHAKDSPLGSMAMYYDILPKHKKEEKKKGEAAAGAEPEEAKANAKAGTQELVYGNNNTKDSKETKSPSTLKKSEKENKLPTTASDKSHSGSTGGEDGGSATTSGESSPYAYMFVIGGIHEDRPAYKGFIYNVLVATSQIRKLGSTYDVVLYVQLSADSNRTRLPEEDIQHLEALNIQIRTLPKPTHGETFASLVFEKFRPLEMTEYKRVIFLDADAIPLANLDYIFHLSDPSHKETPTILRPNLILASRAEACNAGLFMLQPEEGAWDELNKIIDRAHEEGKTLPYPHFNWKRGWGYNFKAENDHWRGTITTGSTWKYHAGHSDQGLLYYWTKFYKRDVSIVIQDEIENWIDLGSKAPLTTDGKPKPVLETKLRGEPLLNFTAKHPTAYQQSCDAPNQKSKDKKHQTMQCVVPYRDFAHFMGGNKPWQDVGCPNCFIKRVGTQTKIYTAATKLWFIELKELDAKLNMNLDFNNWGSKHHTKESPLGSMAMYSHFLPEHKKEKKKRD